MDLPDKVAGLDAHRMRDMFICFLAQKTKFDWNNGAPIVDIPRITSDFIVVQLDVSSQEAQRIEEALGAEGWIYPDKLTPTRKGMALAHATDRPKLSRIEGNDILDRVLVWADQTNAVADARVKVKKIHLFGSLERGADEVGDIDLFVEFSTQELGHDLQPEDMDREDDLLAELQAISEYLSLSSEFDRCQMDDVPKRQVFPQLA